jgi:hypothetical protein
MLTKQYTTPNGANTLHHSIRRIEASFPGEFAVAHVQSFATEDALTQGASPLWSQPLRVPLSAVSSQASIEAWLVADAENPFSGGAVAVFLESNLATAKAKRWAVIKATRATAEFGGFEWDTSTFDSDPQSQSRIQGGAQLATLAMLASQPFSVDWTLADNTVRTLSGADMIAVGQAMGVHIMTVHGAGRALREAIETATTVTEVEAVSWPA